MVLTVSSRSSSIEEPKSFVEMDLPARTHSEMVTLKFHLKNGEVLTRSFNRNVLIEDIKSEFEQLFKVPHRSIVLLSEANVALEEDCPVGSFVQSKFHVLDVKLLCKDKDVEIHLDNAYKDLYVPDIITVNVPKPEGGYREIVVEVKNDKIVKPNLGGYRHRTTGVEYYHGFTQTGPPAPKVPSERQNHRDTQTYNTRNRFVAMTYSRATQMTQKDVWVSSITDKIVTAKKYETAKDRMERLNIEGKVTVIQRYYRGYKTRKKLHEIHEENQTRLRMEAEQRSKELRQQQERIRKDLARTTCPMTRYDFTKLFSLVDRWKKAEIKRINTHYCGAAKVTAFSLMLDKEIVLLRSIEKIRQKVREDLHTKQIVDFFRAIGTPKEWYSNFQHIQLDTLETQKGREFFHLYKIISNKNQSREERLNNYSNLKSIFVTHNCPEGNHTILLLNRAMELLARGLEERFLVILFKRIEGEVLNHFKQPNCNGQVTSSMRRKMFEDMENSLLYCHRCGKLKTLEAFSFNIRSEHNLVCTSCEWLDVNETPCVDLAPYRFILNQIRSYEQKHLAQSSASFILQPKDIHYIVNTIWHGHSALSECNDIYQLTLSRWKNQEDWLPWNCIVLTNEEARIHKLIDKLEDFYEPHFFSHVFNKHILAKNVFKQLIELDDYFLKHSKGDARQIAEFKRKKNECLDVHIEKSDQQKGKLKKKQNYCTSIGKEKLCGSSHRNRSEESSETGRENYIEALLNELVKTAENLAENEPL